MQDRGYAEKTLAETLEKGDCLEDLRLDENITLT